MPSPFTRATVRGPKLFSFVHSFGSASGGACKLIFLLRFFLFYVCVCSPLAAWAWHGRGEPRPSASPLPPSCSLFLSTHLRHVQFFYFLFLFNSLRHTKRHHRLLLLLLLLLLSGARFDIVCVRVTLAGVVHLGVTWASSPCFTFLYPKCRIGRPCDTSRGRLVRKQFPTRLLLLPNAIYRALLFAFFFFFFFF